MLLVICNCCLSSLCCMWFQLDLVSGTSQEIGAKNWSFQSVNWPAVKIFSKMTDNVLNGGTVNTAITNWPKLSAVHFHLLFLEFVRENATKSVTHGYCDAKPTVRSLPTHGITAIMYSTKWYCLVTESPVCVNNLPRVASGSLLVKLLINWILPERG